MLLINVAWQKKQSGFCLNTLFEALVQPSWTDQNILLDKMVHADDLDIPIFRSLHMDPRKVGAEDRLDVISSEDDILL